MCLIIKYLLVLYFLCLINCVFGFWWSETTTTESPQEDWITSEDFYFEDKILQHQIIVPGTNYCGPGNKTADPNNLGRFKNVDACCRDHDSCPDNIPAGKYKHGLHNTAKYTKSHCDCDEIFHNCLKAIGTFPARFVGLLYFSVFHIDCFRKDHPIIECTNRKRRRCIHYKLNITATPVFQWFDNPFFKHWMEQLPIENIINLTNSIVSTTPLPTAINLNSISNNNIEAISHNNNLTTKLNITNSSIETTSNETYSGSLFYNLYSNVIKYLQNLTNTYTGVKNESYETTTLNFLNQNDTNQNFTISDINNINIVNTSN